MSSEQPHADHLADLNHPDISDFSQKDNIALLRKTVHPPERLLVLAEGARKRFSIGLVAVTSERFLFVQSRIIRTPVVLSFPAEEIRDVQIDLALLFGIITLVLADRSVRFDLIKPKERIYPLLWRTRELIGLPPEATSVQLS
jgi:hypothetical protein